MAINKMHETGGLLGSLGGRPIRIGASDINDAFSMAGAQMGAIERQKQMLAQRMAIDVAAPLWREEAFKYRAYDVMNDVITIEKMPTTNPRCRPQDIKGWWEIMTPRDYLQSRVDYWLNSGK